MTSIYPELPFNVKVTYDGGREKEWSRVNYNLTDRWLYIFTDTGTQYMFDTKNMIKVTAYPIEGR